MPCNRCRSRNLVRDDVTGNLVCGDCGSLQPYDNFEAQLWCAQVPQGTKIRIGYAGSGSALDYKAKKIYEANNLIEELTSKLGLTDKLNEIKSMIRDITDGEFGQGNWFPILICACCYVVMRMDKKNVLPMEEVGMTIGCDVYELGRMITRVVQHLGLELPEFDLVGLFIRTVRSSVRLNSIDREKKENIRKQGVFLMNCSVKWYLSTGRRPLPLVMAVLAFVTEINGFSTRIEDLAKEAQVPVSTCKIRYKELLEKLVKVAQVSGLPWGKDITVKNIKKHAGFVIGYMEAKSINKSNDGKVSELFVNGFDLEDVVLECLRKDTGYWKGGDDNVEKVSKYFDVGDENRLDVAKSNVVISHERLSTMYRSFADQVKSGNLTRQSESENLSKRRRGSELVSCGDWWKGKSELSQKLLLKQVLEKDVGLNALPPSYINNCIKVERRREKITAAKLRIHKIRYPPEIGNEIVTVADEEQTGKKKRKRKISEVDWEDQVIETLLLHSVKEEEIEKGHYNTLLDVHVFNSGEV